MTNHGATADDRDERLALLLARLTDEQRQGKRADVVALGREHPDLIDELKQLLSIGQLAAEFGQSNGNSQSTIHYQPQETLATAGGSLPRGFGDYELLEELGRGAMGVVYKAWDLKLRRFVALKMLLRGEHATPTDVQRFRSEAQSAAALSHPNIVPVYQVGECDGLAYFCMKQVEGTTLAQRAAEGPLPSREAARIVAAIARAVQHAHEQGVLHRDLKPSNVLLDSESNPLVTDFGLAKLFEGGASLTATGGIVGTPSYMAPEQATPGPASASPRSDVYSLGAILYELLTGRPPFQAASAVDVLLLVRSEDAVRPRLLNPQIDADVEFICLKCLEKRPEHRYASAAELVRDLEAFLNSEPVSARLNSPAYFISRLLRDTHHAPVLANWGVLWMWHSAKIMVLCLVTNAMYLLGVRTHLPYLLLWSISLIGWGFFFWHWRRRGGPVTFVERQMAHAWGAGVTGSVGVFVVEYIILPHDPLKLFPLLAILAGMVFLFEAGTLSGWFYIAATVSFATAIPMALFPDVAPTLFGLASAFGFFLPGMKYYRQKRLMGRGG